MQRVKYTRIRISIFACAYELFDISLISDSEYDQLAQKVDYISDTDNPILDKFFHDYYTPHSGFWVRSHPELYKLCQLTKSCIDGRVLCIL